MRDLYSTAPPQNKLSTLCKLPSFVSKTLERQFNCVTGMHRNLILLDMQCFTVTIPVLARSNALY